jgi:DNA invertase Pin-like site-specific DNA recombinase
MRAAAYARVSSSRQRDQHTIESQLRALPAYIAAQGWTLVDTYIDDGKSAKAGKLDARDGFARLLADAIAGRFDVVVVVAIDRLTRSEDQIERTAITGGLQRAGVKIAVVGAGVQDMGTFTGDAYVTLQALFAAEENRKRRERTIAGKLTAIARGKKPSGPTPYGYRYERGDERHGIPFAWALDPVTAPIVVEMFERVAAGESCEQVARDLERRGVPRVREGRWIRERVWQTVRARTYVGEWTADKRRELVVAVPPIVSVDLWQRAQDEMIAHGKRGLSRTRHVYLIEKLARCEQCGAMIGIAAANAHTVSKYLCAHRRRPPLDVDRCTLPLHPTAGIDAEVWATVADILGREDLVADALRRRRAASADAPMWEADLAAARAHLERLERAGAAILIRFERGLIAESAMDESLTRIARERETVTRQARTAEQALSRAGSTASQTDALEARLAAVRSALPRLGPEERRDLVRAFVAPGSLVLGSTVASGRLLLSATSEPIGLVREVSTSYVAPGVGFRVGLRLVGRSAA